MMNQQYPSALLENAVNELATLPGIGRKTALRLALYMLRREPDYTERFSTALLALRRLFTAHCSNRTPVFTNFIFLSASLFGKPLVARAV